MNETRETLEKHGWPGADLRDCPASAKRFADGAQYRIEIPSTEGPRAFRAVLEEAAVRGVPVRHRSPSRVRRRQIAGLELAGSRSGIMLLTDDEIQSEAALGREHSI